MQSPSSIVYVPSRIMSDRKRTVIELLKENTGFVSGEAISETLGISRNAVHKHINSLRKRGYRILGVSRRGYRLEHEPTTLVMARVADLTQESILGRAFRHHEEIESTNLEAKALAIGGASEGTVVIAESQYSGRGRQGRRWTSPAGKGLLFSVILRPEMDMTNVHFLTLVTAVAAAEAIEESTGVPVHVKWPNDLFVADKKVGGILLEVAGEQDYVDWVVVGVGVNVNTDFVELPVPLRRSAISLKMAAEQLIDRETLLAELLVALEKHYLRAVHDGFEHVLTAFRERDYLLKKDVSVETREGHVVGKASGIDDHGALLVELPGRRVRRFHSGDVTLHR